MKLFACLLLLFFIPLSYLPAASLWQEGSLYTPPSALTPGKTLTVIIDDVSRLRYTLDVKSDSADSVVSTPDSSITAYLPAVSSNKDISHSDGMNVESRGNLELKVAVTINQAQADGTYAITGNKSYIFNGVASRIAVSGRINPADLEGNTVRAEKINNFQMSISTTTQGLNMNLARQLGEDESASTDLTEAEKQQIITDYLEKIISELSK